MKILVVEDEKNLAAGLVFNLEAEGFDAVVAETGEAALEQLAAGAFDAVVLDIMLPGISGLDVAATMRERADHTPVMMLTAMGRPEDVLLGFEAGTDDYLAKPFELRIFLARLNGLLRRSTWVREGSPKPKAETVEINGKTIDFTNLELRSGDETIHLTLMEIRLLRYLVDHAGSPVSRKTILEDVWGLQEDTDTRAIDNFIVRLRKYLEDDPANPTIVRTVRGVGYKFVFPNQRPE